jgi:DNA-binding GntR family transcriptional regulator
MKPIELQPGLAEQVYQILLDAICEGRLAPGTHLVQEQLAATLRVSRQPIQQALAMLRGEGLVQELGRRGLFVAPLDVATMRDHYQIRAALDGLAARLAATRAAASKSGAAEIKRGGLALIAAGSDATDGGDVAAMVQRDVDFHNYIYACSGNPLIAEAAEKHWRYLRRVMSEVLRRAEPAPAIWRQHREILDAILCGDEEAAEQKAVTHVRLASDRLQAALTKQTADADIGSQAAGPIKQVRRVTADREFLGGNDLDAGRAHPRRSPDRAGPASAR